MFMPHRLGLFVLCFHGVFRLSRIVQLHDEACVWGEEDWLMKKAAKPKQEKGFKKKKKTAEK